MKIRSKLSLLFLLLSAGIILFAAIFSTFVLEDYFRSHTLQTLLGQTNQVEFVIRDLGSLDSLSYDHLQRFVHSSGIRLTLIDTSGNVIFESDLPYGRLSTVENHSHRPEVEEAKRQGTGSSLRHSATLNTDMLYLAKRLDHPFPRQAGFERTEFLRLGIPLLRIDQTMADIRSKIMITGVICLIVAILLSVLVSGWISRPANEMVAIAKEIQEGNLERRIPIRSKDELGILGETLNSMVEKLNEDIKKLRTLERVRSEFLGNVSHELRTPIFAVQGMLETLLNGAIDDKEVNKDFVERALKNTQNLNALLGDLIEISRIESGEMKMSFRYFDLGDFLRQAALELQPIAEQQHVTLHALPSQEPYQVYGDKERLNQVLTNLIGNAIKYNKPGGTVHLSAEALDGSVRISVTDTGIGVAAEHLSRIFERFYRVDKERSRETGGTGLGLAIVKHIIEAHGGKVEVESAVGRGSVFSFTLKSIS
ncbi:MAG TPA: ATP-binding protein [Bacteroidota bacterium]|jgi:two-component system phosphate regulon sensor histidine kinase PhoR|nr:ATP-binding protein [Bacteroidota bacterium]